MAIVIPALIPESLESLVAHISVLQEVTRSYQIDIVDGAFVPFVSWPYQGGDDVSAINTHIKDVDVEFDLMIKDPENTLDDWLRTPAQRFIIHVESTENIALCIDKVKSAGRKIGLSLNNDTDLSVLKPFLEDIDFIQCMGIAEIGRQGNAFDERVLDRIRRIKEFHPEMEVSVDGSVNFETIGALKEAGADRLVSGSAILKAESSTVAYTELSALVA